ncbi:unnamed protein product [Penicillium salamii]|uniref:Uncharacterized protein n=1 Tax=Penicillium salamii TaxID=1612424 RepID=A0A9W4NA87_9EURO|nr:unnamed protein product [Penicillium salamii]CAG8008269.1 unnamed protein product [Penicillium salamii]CAG8065622.1 unnamed protein product [Penicillium salamii]CAG8248897.1 unnamed protein product [Penicillium salamii]CAG8307809.1 unnamed protein product [Penicillium salamii]
MGARSILPLILLLVFVGILAAVGFIVYSIVQDVGKNTREKMERKNIAFTKDGMKVQVREIKDEAYKDRTQRCVCSCQIPLSWHWTNSISYSVLVNMWNHTSFPAYKSRLWDMSGSSATDQQNAEKRK